MPIPSSVMGAPRAEREAYDRGRGLTGGSATQPERTYRNQQLDEEKLAQAKVLMEAADPMLRRMYTRMTHEQVIKKPEYKGYLEIMAAVRNAPEPLNEAEMKRALRRIRELDGPEW